MENQADAELMLRVGFDGRNGASWRFQLWTPDRRLKFSRADYKTKAGAIRSGRKVGRLWGYVVRGPFGRKVAE